MEKLKRPIVYVDCFIDALISLIKVYSCNNVTFVCLPLMRT